jgi:hypothetical protein
MDPMPVIRLGPYFYILVHICHAFFGTYLYINITYVHILCAYIDIYVFLLAYKAKLCQTNALYAENFKKCNSASPISGQSCSISAGPTLAPTTPDFIASQHTRATVRQLGLLPGLPLACRQGPAQGPALAGPPEDQRWPAASWWRAGHSTSYLQHISDCLIFQKWHVKCRSFS